MMIWMSTLLSVHWDERIPAIHSCYEHMLRPRLQQSIAAFASEMRILSKLRHPCITSVMGAVVEGAEPLLIMELMDLGSLHDLLHNNTVVVEGALVLPILQDVAHGMRFLHSSENPIVHGDIKSANILVDIRFRAKVADFGLTQKRCIGLPGTPAFMAPELLRGETSPTPMSDVYAFAIVLCEVYSRENPYAGEDLATVLVEVADQSKVQDKRCKIPRACPPEIVGLIRECWHRNPACRPKFARIESRLHMLDEAKASPLVNFNSSFRQSSRRERTSTDELLYEMLPKHVIEALSLGKKAEPDTREMASIFLSDIVNFTGISTTMSAFKTTDMLDRLYSKFDALAQAHKIFKVDTIGDAYMAVSNLAEDQADDHALRIAKFALDIKEVAAQTLIDEDNPSLGPVQIRIGIHCGPVVGSVVGTKKPKYTLFGDSVNTTSRMESSSISDRIQLSEQFATLLREQGPSMEMKCRGTIEIKGKGFMTTFWLLRQRVPGALQLPYLEAADTVHQVPEPCQLENSHAPCPGEWHNPQTPRQNGLIPILNSVVT